MTCSGAEVSLDPVISFAQAQDAERDLLQRVTEGPETALFKVWRTEQALIVPRGMPSRAHFGAAAALAEGRGWPVFERDTGGDLAPQMPGVVNISCAFRMTGEAPNIGLAYHRLTQPVLGFLKDELELAACLSAIPGAFCDGAFNIAIENKKLAGTAQRWKLLNRDDGTRSVAVLGHVALMCDMDLAPAIAVINDFYTACHIDRYVELDKHTTLRKLISDDRLNPARIADALERRLTKYGI